jgi:hypothetical protein
MPDLIVLIHKENLHPHERQTVRNLVHVRALNLPALIDETTMIIQ